MKENLLLYSPEPDHSANEMIVLICIILRKIDLYYRDLEQGDFVGELNNQLYFVIERISRERNHNWDLVDFLDYLRESYPEILHHEDFRIAEGINYIPFSKAIIDDKIDRIKIHAQNYKLKKTFEETLLEMNNNSGEIVNLAQKAHEKSKFILIKNKEKNSFKICDTLQQSVKLYFENYSNKKKVTGIETNFEDIDLLGGGLIPGKIFGIAAPPGGCKTTVALNMMLNCALNENRCLFFSLEMELVSEITPRLLSNLTQIPYNDILLGTFNDDNDQLYSFRDGARILNELPILVANSYYNTLDKLLNHSRQQFYRNPDLKIIFIDHLHELKIENYRKDDVSMVSEIMSRLKDLAQELGVAIVLLCQVSKGSSTKGQNYVPSMRDLKGSSRIEETVNTLLILEKIDDFSEIKFHCVKNRSGKLFETSHKINYSLAKVYEKSEYDLIQ